MLDELFRKSPAAPDAPPEQPFGASAIAFAYIGVIAALAMSLSLNIYHDAYSDTGKSVFHPLPVFIAVLVGVVIPLLCGVLSHLGAEVDSGAIGKLILYAIVGALMYVSARAGTAVLTPVMGRGTAIVAAVAADSAAMYCIHILMKHRDRMKALAKWNEGAAERKRREDEAARRAEAAALSTRNSAARRPVTPGGNTGGNTRTAPGGNSGRRSSAGPGPEQLTAGSGAGERPGSPGNVTAIASRQASPGKPEAKSDDQIRLLIEAFYEHCVKSGEQFGLRAFMRAENFNNPKRIGPLINEFLDSRQGAAAGGEEAG